MLAPDGAVLARKVAPTQSLGSEVAALAARFDVGRVALGGSTTSKQALSVLRECCPRLQVEVIDERATTEEARRRYWSENPPRGLWVLIPIAWRVPPRPVDDYAAVLLAEKLLRRS